MVEVFYENSAPYVAPSLLVKKFCSRSVSHPKCSVYGILISYVLELLPFGSSAKLCVAIAFFPTFIVIL